MNTSSSAIFSPAERAIYHAHINALVRERRKRDPEKVRARDRAKYLRRVQRDRAGFMATRRAQALRRRQQKKVVDEAGLVIELVC